MFVTSAQERAFKHGHTARMNTDTKIPNIDIAKSISLLVYCANNAAKPVQLVDMAWWVGLDVPFVLVASPKIIDLSAVRQSVLMGFVKCVQRLVGVCLGAS